MTAQELLARVNALFSAPVEIERDDRNILYQRTSTNGAVTQYGVQWPEAPHLGTYWYNKVEDARAQFVGNGARNG